MKFYCVNKYYLFYPPMYVGLPLQTRLKQMLQCISSGKSWKYRSCELFTQFRHLSKISARILQQVFGSPTKIITTNQKCHHSDISTPINVRNRYLNISIIMMGGVDMSDKIAKPDKSRKSYRWYTKVDWMMIHLYS